MKFALPASGRSCAESARKRRRRPRDQVGLHPRLSWLLLAELQKVLVQPILVRVSDAVETTGVFDELGSLDQLAVTRPLKQLSRTGVRGGEVDITADIIDELVVGDGSDDSRFKR